MALERPRSASAALAAGGRPGLVHDGPPDPARSWLGSAVELGRWPEAEHLWWKRWGEPEDFFWLFALVDGQCNDTWLVPTELTENEVEDWAAGRYEHGDEVLRLVWVHEDEAQQLRETEFGVIKTDG